MPASNTPRMTTIAVKVRCAWVTVGARKAPTPLLTASTPVIAVQPLAKARNSSQTDTAAAVVISGGGGGGGPAGAGTAPPGRAGQPPGAPAPPPEPRPERQGRAPDPHHGPSTSARM